MTRPLTRAIADVGHRAAHTLIQLVASLGSLIALSCWLASHAPMPPPAVPPVLPGYEGPPVFLDSGSGTLFAPARLWFAVPSPGFTASIDETLVEGDCLTVRATLLETPLAQDQGSRPTTVSAFLRCLVCYRRTIVEVRQLRNGGLASAPYVPARAWP